MDYIIEKCHNIKQVHVYLPCPDPRHPPLIRFIEPRKILCRSHPATQQTGSPQWEKILSFDCDVDTRAGKNTMFKDFMLVKIPILRDVLDNEQDDFPSSFELGDGAIQHLWCRSCSTCLTKVGRFDKILPLPSEYWEELQDIWFCQASPAPDKAQLAAMKKEREEQEKQQDKCSVGETSTKSALPQKQQLEVVAKGGRCLVGTNHVLLHASDLDVEKFTFPSNIPLSESEHETLAGGTSRWISIACRNCSLSVGKAAFIAPARGSKTNERISELMGTRLEGEVKLFKHSLTSVTPPGCVRSSTKDSETDKEKESADHSTKADALPDGYNAKCNHCGMTKQEQQAKKVPINSGAPNSASAFDSRSSLSLDYAKENGEPRAKVGGSLPRCGGCKRAFFCSVKCQRLGWPAHRKMCWEAQGKIGEGAKAASLQKRATENKKANIFSPYTLERYVSTEMFAASQAHITNLFLVTDSEFVGAMGSKKDGSGIVQAVWIVLLNWESFLRTPHFPHSHEGSRSEDDNYKMAPMFKVLYHHQHLRYLSGSRAEESKEQVDKEEAPDSPKKAEPKQTEVIQLSTSDVEAFVSVIKSRSKLLPGSLADSLSSSFASTQTQPISSLLNSQLGVSLPPTLTGKSSRPLKKEKFRISFISRLSRINVESD